MNDIKRAASERKFLDWQREYAEKNIPTFPMQITAEEKKPLISQFQRIGLPASAQIARKFADARGIGFMAGPRSNITVLDVDEPGDKPLQKALDRHGETPLIIRTASGKHHGYYRYNGEGRMVRPEPGTEVDILGGGIIIAPPSQSPKGNYQFIAGSLDDLDRLPIMRDVPERPNKPAPCAKLQHVGRGRNVALFNECMRMAKRCDNLDQLLDRAREFNSQLPNPLEEDETVKTATSAWGYETSGLNRFGQFGAFFPYGMIDGLLQDPDAFLLLAYLRANNGPWAEFMVANGLAKKFGWGDKRLSAARRRLIERGDIKQVKLPHKGSAALYEWTD